MKMDDENKNDKLLLEYILAEKDVIIKELETSLYKGKYSKHRRFVYLKYVFGVICIFGIGYYTGYAHNKYFN